VPALVLVPVRTVLALGRVFGTRFRVLSRPGLSCSLLSCSLLACPLRTCPVLAVAGGRTLRQADAVLRASIRQVRVADRPDRAGRLCRLLVLAAVVLLATVLLPAVLRGTVLLAVVVRVAAPILDGDILARSVLDG
jgi:hypothetical protein